MTPRYSNITNILSHYGQSDLLAFMDRYEIEVSEMNTKRKLPADLP